MATRLKIKVEQLLLLFGSIFICLIFSELAFRIWAALPAIETIFTSKKSWKLSDIVHPSSSLKIKYELRPNLNGHFQGNPFSTNSFGMREREIGLEKPPNTIRIAGVGDSILFGWGVKAEDSYLRIVEERLNNQQSGGTKFQTLNFAVPGYNTSIESAVIEEKVINFAPDILILHLVNNDWDAPPSFIQNENLKHLTYHSYLLDFVKTRLNSSPTPQNGALVGFDVGASNGQIGRRQFIRSMRKIVSFLQKHRIKLYVIYGTPSRIQRITIDNLAKKYHFQTIRLKPYVDKFVSERNIANDPRARAKLLMLSDRDPHPSALGHKIYAEAILDTFSMEKNRSLSVNSQPSSATSTVLLSAVK